MLRNYLTVAVRNLLRHKGYSAINLFGLAVGMACCILILLFIQDEFRHVDYHPNAHRIFKILIESKLSEGRPEFREWLPGGIALAMRDEFPEIQVVGRTGVTNYTKHWIRSGDKVLHQFFGEADTEFLEIFSYPLVSGNPVDALAQPGSVLITENAAKRFFGNEDPIGKIVTFAKYDMNYKITGVLRDIPKYAHLRFDFLASPNHPQAPEQFRKGWSEWNTRLQGGTKIYLTLHEGHSHIELERKLRDFIARHTNEKVASSNVLHLQPINREYLYTRADYGFGQDRIGRIYRLATLGIAILLIACINFMNLVTARSASRAKEVGMRKVVGASRRQLILQFQSESILMSLIAFILAYGIAELALPTFNTLMTTNGWMPADMTLEITNQGTFFLRLVVLALIVGIIAGSYPALFLSAFQPAKVLKGSNQAGVGNRRLRQGLIVFQFAISTFLIISTVVINNQINYMKYRDLGFNKNFLIITPILEADPSLAKRYETVKRAFLQHPNVLKATSTWPGISDWETVYTEGIPENERTVGILGIDEDFLDTYEVELIAGRNLNLSIASDSTEAFILNETAVKKFGWTDPIGKQITWGKRKGRVIGVIKDFHERSLRYPIEPIVFLYWPNRYISLRIKPHDIPETMAFLRKTWAEWIPDQPPYFDFLDRWFERQYRVEDSQSRIYSIMSGLAILVACLGLFGLAAYTVERRTKEIGVRKVLGASVTNIVALLSKEFVILVGVANLIAWPVAYYAMSRWLQDFAYRIDLGVGVFVLGGILVLVIALMTVSVQAIKAARANPVDALRYE
jgi:putative ABC transport system permease protein